MSNSARLHIYWQHWQGKLETILTSRSARLLYPAVQQTASDEVSQTYGLSHPICILNAPQKASTTRRAKRMHILIDGTFRLEEASDHPCLKHASCNITLFDPTERDDGSLDLVLSDALHFDVESPEKEGVRRRFHPFFHVQRGISHEDEVIKNVFSQATRLSVDEIRVDQTAKDRIGHPYLRIPTPQLDLFSVMTMVAADCFCNAGDAEVDARSDRTGPKTADTNIEALFVSLLQLLTQSSNVVRETDTAQMLTRRVMDKQLMSAGHWYPEWS
jgi:hypothetical protein